MSTVNMSDDSDNGDINMSIQNNNELNQDYDCPINNPTNLDEEYEKETLLLKENFYDNKIAELLFNEYGDRDRFLKAIIRLYKYIKSDEKKQTWEKTEKELIEDITTANFVIDVESLSKNIQKQMNIIESYDSIIGKKIEAFNVFTDFCYIYHIQEYDMHTPFHKLPMNVLKYNMISACLKMKENDTTSIFHDIIKNKFLSDLRQEPPFMMRTEMNNEEIKQKLDLLVKPLCKDLLNSLLRHTHGIKKNE